MLLSRENGSEVILFKYQMCIRDRIKALFITNPSNPPSYALSPETAARIVNIVKNDNPNLMIITDDVYGTFIPHFRSLMAELPHKDVYKRQG